MKHFLPFHLFTEIPKTTVYLKTEAKAEIEYQDFNFEMILDIFLPGSTLFSFRKYQQVTLTG